MAGVAFAATPRDKVPANDSTAWSSNAILIWTLATTIWSLLTPPNLTFATRMILFQPSWLLRATSVFSTHDDATWIQDLAIFLVVNAATSWWADCRENGGLLPSNSLIGQAWSVIASAESETILIYAQMLGLLGLCGALAGGIVARGKALEAEAEEEEQRKSRVQFQTIEEYLLPPLLIPSRTAHTRLVPVRHAFEYSYLLVGIPVGMTGRLGNCLSVDGARPSWFHVRSNDYLSRNTETTGLSQRLHAYLTSQAIKEDDYAFAYLVTAPRFLGYSFNPVSFWYLYDTDTKLKYMVLEVNNTFDERRVYLLKRDDAASQIPDINPRTTSSRTVVFSQTWSKDFHVSPFNDRDGSYSLRATDPLAASQEAGDGKVKIDNTIVLRTHNTHEAKIVARVWSSEQPSDAVALSSLGLIRFIARWWWVGLVTLPRIVWQAQQLYLRKGLELFYRPEVTLASLGRSYTSDEKFLEELFCDWLAHAVEEVGTKRPLRVVYEAAHSTTDHGDGNGESQIILQSPQFIGSRKAQDVADSTLTLKVLSPAFYSRFVHYAFAREAFDRECLATDERNRTLVLENACLLPLLLDAFDDIEASAKTNTSRTRGHFGDPLLSLRWHLLRMLRCPPTPASFPKNGKSETLTSSVPSASPHSSFTHDFNVQDIRNLNVYSEFDRYIMFQTPATHYPTVVLKLFLAQRYSLGLPFLLSVLDTLFRATLLFAALVISENHSDHAWDVLRLPLPNLLSRQQRKYSYVASWFGWAISDRNDVRWYSTAAVLAAVNAVHGWAWVKG